MNMTPNSQMIYTMTVLWKFMNMTLNSQMSYTMAVLWMSLNRTLNSQMIYTMTALWMSDIQQSDDLHNNRAVNVWHSSQMTYMTVLWMFMNSYNIQQSDLHNEGRQGWCSTKVHSVVQFPLGFLGISRATFGLAQGANWSIAVNLLMTGEACLKHRIVRSVPGHTSETLDCQVSARTDVSKTQDGQVGTRTDVLDAQDCQVSARTDMLVTQDYQVPGQTCLKPRIVRSVPGHTCQKHRIVKSVPGWPCPKHRIVKSVPGWTNVKHRTVKSVPGQTCLKYRIVKVNKSTRLMHCGEFAFDRTDMPETP